MRKKIGLLILWILLVIASAFGLVKSNKYNNAIGAAFAGALITIFLEKVWHAVEDLTDVVDWKVSLRKLLRGKIIRKDTIIRISFAYLYRIKVNGKYLLVKNSRGTGKYQPVGGVYKLKGNERTELNKLFHVVDDAKVPIDESSRDDYRLQMPCKYLRKFVKRFDSQDACRERINDVSREFSEELNPVLKWEKIRYRYCGRHMTELKYGDHFQCYELLLADIVDLMPAEEQLRDLEWLQNEESDQYKFATAEEIKKLGIITGTNKMEEWVADHSNKILQENEQYLLRGPHVDEVYEVDL